MRFERPWTWAFVFVGAWAFGYTFNALALDPDLAWTKAMYWQKRQIAVTLPAVPRLLFAGGSGVHYSVDALEVEQVTGMPSVNLGLHAGLGLNALLRITLDLTRAGDIVVLIPEYGILADVDGSGWLSGMFGAAIRRPGIGGFGMMQTAKELFRSGVTNQTSVGKGFVRTFFGVQGAAGAVDERGSTAIFPEGVAAPSVINGQISEPAARRLEAFADEVRSRGAHLLIGLPWYLVERTDTTSINSARAYAAELNRFARVLHGESFDVQTDPSLFSDTCYHLTFESRTARSRALAQHIVAALQETSDGPRAPTARRMENP